METKKIIFVGGIHGVGKTTFCKGISGSSNIESFSSGDLISRFESRGKKGDKKVDDIQGNQDILSKAVEEFLCEDKNYLLDGHFCLLDKTNGITRIPLSIFESLGIIGIIILIDDERDILNRLKRRDDIDYSLELIKEFQRNEINYGKYVADLLKIPLRIVNVSQEDLDMLSIIMEWMG